MKAEIIDFYNGGAQVQSTTGGTDMTHSFTADGDGETVDHGYVPKANSKLVEGASYDTVTVGGQEYLLLKAGYTYDVKLITAEGDDDISEIIGAPDSHVSLPLPKGVTDVEVTEYVPAEPEDPAEQSDAPELGDGTVVETTPSETPEDPTEEQLAEDAARKEAEGTLGNDDDGDSPDATEE